MAPPGRSWRDRRTALPKRCSRKGRSIPSTATTDIARFSWELVSKADGSAPVAGFDVIRLAEDGRIRSVLGFLDRVPTLG